ncbi:MAG: hypothetical protein R2772_08570 [Chitinophagales bacterium]
MRYLFQYILLNLGSIMVKRFFILLILSLSSTYAFTQGDTTKLFYAKKFHSAAFVELASNIIQTNHSSGMNVDFSANWLVQHQYYLGASFAQLASFEKFSSTEIGNNRKTETKLNFQSFGLRFGYILFPDKKVFSLSPDLSLRWARIKVETKEEEHILHGANIVPALKGVFNVSSYFRIGLQLQYNVFVFKKLDTSQNPEALYSTQLQAKDLSGIGGGIFLRIGRF